MNATQRLLEQRSVGHVKFHMGVDGPVDLREAGAAKLRNPRGTYEAILINVGGGLAGGDDFKFEISCAAGGTVTLTTQAAERVYRSLGPAAHIATSLRIEKSGALYWLPFDTIIYDGAKLRRTYHVNLAPNATFLAVEPFVFGRTAAGEVIESLEVKDSWRIFREGVLIHADEFYLGPDLPKSEASLSTSLAMATIIYVAEDAESKLNLVRASLDEKSAASAWNGKLIARVLAQDGFCLRKALIPVMLVLAGPEHLPKNWSM